MNIDNKESMHLTKYAVSLKDGVIPLVVGEVYDETPKWFWVKRRLYHIGTDVHRSADKAIARANLLRDRKIVSLEKQIKRLRNLTFSVKEPVHE